MKLTVFTSFADQMIEDAAHYIQNLGNCIRNFGVLGEKSVKTAILNRYAGLSPTGRPQDISSIVIGFASGPKEKTGEDLRPLVLSHDYKLISSDVCL